MAARKVTYPDELRAFNTALDSAVNLEKYFIENTAIECFSYHGTGPWFKEVRLNRLFDDLNFIFVDNSGQAWQTIMKFNYEKIKTSEQQRYGVMPVTKYVENTLSFKDGYFKADWKPVNKIVHGIFLQTNEQLKEIIYNNNPYLYDYAEKELVDPQFLILAPQLEILDKAGFDFVKNIINDSFYTFVNTSDKDVQCFNRLTKPGRNPKEIFKTSKVVFNMLTKRGL